MYLSSGCCCISTQNETILKHWSHWCFKFAFCFPHSLCLIWVWLKVNHPSEAVSTQDNCWLLLILLKLRDTTVYNLCQDFGYILLFLPETRFLLIFRELFSISLQFHPLRLFLSHLIFLLHFIFFFCNCYYPLASSNLCCSLYLVELQGKGKTQDILCSREYRNAFSWSLMKYSIGKYGCVNTLWVLWFQCVFLKIGKWDDCSFQRDWWRKNVSVDLVLPAIVRTQDFSAHKA